jgi:hypothetical protein
VLILTAAAVFLSVTGSSYFISPLNIAGLLCTAVIASALFACVIFLTNSRILIPVGILSFAISFMTTGNLASALGSLTYIFVGAFIYFGIKGSRSGKSQSVDKTEMRQFRRTQITVAAAGFLSLFFAGIFVAHILVATGAFSFAAVSSVIDAELAYHIENYLGMFPQYAEAVAAEEYSAEDVVRELVMNIKVVLPACFIVFNLSAAYLSTALFRFAYNIFIPMANPGRKKIKNKYWRINMSVISAIIMLISIFAAMLFSGWDNLLPSIVLTNLIYILIPGFCVMGAYFLFDKLFNSSMGTVPIIILMGIPVLFSFIFPFMIVMIAVFLMVAGLYSALIGDIKKFYEKTKKLMFGDSDDDLE